jgi:hypothetical protein
LQCLPPRCVLPAKRGVVHCELGALMTNNSQYAANMVLLVASTTAFIVIDIKPALAEFQIQEAGIEKGESEFEYRGAYHWGVPKATDENENANDLIQSHELEASYALTNWWLLQFTVGSEQPLGESFNISDVELESEFALIKRQGNGIALSFQAGYEQAINHGNGEGDPNQIGFGPIVELASGSFLLTLNPIFTKQVGPFANQEGLGFDYGWRAEYDFAKRWGAGVEMFGEVESLADSGSFNDQVHSIGPTLFYNPAAEEEGEGQNGDDNEAGGPAKMAFSMNVGIQFGLTDATSDTALKFQGSLNF